MGWLAYCGGDHSGVRRCEDSPPHTSRLHLHTHPYSRLLLLHLHLLTHHPIRGSSDRLSTTSCSQHPASIQPSDLPLPPASSIQHPTYSIQHPASCFHPTASQQPAPGPAAPQKILTHHPRHPAHPCTPPVKSLTIKCLTTYEEISRQGPL